MPSFLEATVVAVLSERPGLQRVRVEREQAGEENAYVLTQLIGPVAVGDRLIVNTTAVDLELGTGGWHVAHWNLSRTHWSAPGPGHVLKLRYTSLQVDAGVEEEKETFQPVDLDGTPVVVCLLHSQIAAVVATAKSLYPELRIAYVMTDQASLPLALSDLVHSLKERQLLAATVSAGQAFGGDFEAVNSASALQIAKARAGADLIVVAQGPGVVGTGTELAFGGLEMVGVLDDVARAGGMPVLAVRWSGADPRPRHRGLSHHSLTVLRRARPGVTLGVPAGFELPPLEGHHIQCVDVPPVETLFRELDLDVTTMGRSPAADPDFFAFAAAAGVVAVQTPSVET